MRRPRFVLLLAPALLSAHLLGTHAVAGEPVGKGPDLASVTPESLGRIIASLPERRAVRGGEAYAEGLHKTEELLIEALEGFGYRVQTHRVRYAPHRGAGAGGDDGVVITRNIWVDLVGTEHPEKVVIFSAHFDTVPGSPGANDNGSGVAAVLEGARVLADHPAPSTIRFMFFTAEEFGLTGSRRYLAEVLQPQLDAGEASFIGCVNLDVMGYYSDEPGSQVFPRGYPSEPDRAGDFVAVLTFAAQAGFAREVAKGMLGVEPEVKIELTDFLPFPLPDMMRSDHGPFWNAGLPAVHLTDTANFRYSHYHKATDTVDRLNLPVYARVSRASIGAVMHLAGAKAGERGDAEPDADKREAGDASANHGRGGDEKAAAP